MASWYLCGPAASTSGSPPPEWIGELGEDASTWLVDQRPICTQWLGFTLLKQMPYPLGAFPHLPRLPPWREWSTAFV